MHPHLFVTLRAIHILAASLWVGAAVLNAAYVLPSMLASGPAGGQVMRVMAQVRKLPVFMNTVMVTTILSGAWLYWVASGGLQWSWIGSRSGLTFTLGALVAITATGLGQALILPVVKRLGQLGAAIATSGGPPTPQQAAEMGALQKRLLNVSRVGSTLVVLALLLMVVARYQ